MPKQITITSEAIDEGVTEYETFDEAYAALMASLEPGSSICLHSEECALVDGTEESQCDCVPLVLTKGAST
jgi:hypothetical protein